MSLNPVSKTGLIASPKKTIHRKNQFSDHLNLSKCAVAKPVMFSLRPFSGLFNPYSKSCSILCNHPGPHEVKTVVKQAKDAWISEAKSHFHRDNGDDVSGSRAMNDINEHIPEEFFKRYTGSDSRPLTPTPTVASGRTRVSTGSHANARRCFTPDPVNSCAKERKQLILDLRFVTHFFLSGRTDVEFLCFIFGRRSHSQETLFWNASSELSAGGQTRDTNTKNGATANGAKNMRLCEQEAQRKSAERVCNCMCLPNFATSFSQFICCAGAYRTRNCCENKKPNRQPLSASTTKTNRKTKTMHRDDVEDDEKNQKASPSPHFK